MCSSPSLKFKVVKVYANDVRVNHFRRFALMESAIASGHRLLSKEKDVLYCLASPLSAITKSDEFKIERSK